jgi:hypothetical protein
MEGAYSIGEVMAGKILKKSSSAKKILKQNSVKYTP